MRIGITTFGANGGRSETGRYVFNLLRELASTKSRHEFDIVGPASDRLAFTRNKPGWNWIDVPAFWQGKTTSLLWQQFGLASLARRRRWDAVLVVGGAQPVPASMPCPIIGVVSDLSSIRTPSKENFLHRVWSRRGRALLLRRLDGIVTVSQSARDEITEFAQVPHDRFDIIPPAHDIDPLQLPDRAQARSRIARKYRVSGPFLLYVSSIEHPEKNHAELIRAFEHVKHRLPEGCKLVLVGAGGSRASEVRRAASWSSVADSIIFTGFVPQKEMSDFYAAAHAFIFPSLRESFGTPILEAMASGLPVACSNLSSMPEVAGGAALMFDPKDPDELERALLQITTDAALRQSLVEKGSVRARSFSWARTAAFTIRSIERTASARTLPELLRRAA